ncbi:MAG: hypothetical protein E6Q24_07565 [Chitinophagaceae bacterium]|nr:hypothetical protein [Sphingobacteriales bacterium]OJW01012.1 MAG: hypothetical protein BGO52_06135 [Sphingobacteriales bacterium 44-61]TXJ27681.1 MAG: hypothetical protein E6Q24_07565 [Chitinophagaceae bacterium]
MKTNSSILKAASRKLGLSLLLAATAAVAFATLGDGKINKDKPRKLLLNNKASSIKPGSFSLQTGYTFRGSQVINEEETKYINLNSTVVTYQQGHTVYTLPVRKKVTLNLNSQKNQVPSATVNINF